MSHGDTIRTGGFLRVLLALCAGCQSPELAGTNVANVPGGGPIPIPSAGTKGTLHIANPGIGYSDSLAGIRTAMTAMFGSPATLARLDVNACTPPALGGSKNCVCDHSDSFADARAA